MRLKPQGAGRFVSAAFLLFWLCGWAVGEGFALWILGKGASALLTGESPADGGAPLEAGPAVAFGAFLLLWLALWTLGGIAAMGAVLRLLWSEDRLIAHAGGLTAVRFRGPFRRTREFPRDTVRRIVLVPRNDTLGVEMARETVELSCLGTRAEREETARALRSELGLSPDETATEPGVATEPAVATLPKGWQEIITPEGERALVSDLATRKIQARVLGFVTLGMGTVALFLLGQSMGLPALLPLGLISMAASLALAWGTVWLARGRMEWRIEGGKVTLRRRFRSSVRDVFEAHRLELTIRSDSDGDDWFTLEAVAHAVDAPAAGPAPIKPAKNRRGVTSSIHDPDTPRKLGAWLAGAAKIPFENRTTREAREAEVAVLRMQLEQSGRLGRFAARLLVKAMERRGKV